MYIELYIHVILTLVFFPHKPVPLSSNNVALTPLSTFQRAIKLRKKLIQISRVGLIALFFPTTSIRLNMQGRIFLFFVLIFSLSNFFIFNACLSVSSSDICVLSCVDFRTFSISRRHNVYIEKWESRTLKIFSTFTLFQSSNKL